MVVLAIGFGFFDGVNGISTKLTEFFGRKARIDLSLADPTATAATVIDRRYSRTDLFDDQLE
jgi:hypothetical protein